MLSDAQLLRYARNILLPQVDVAGQERLLGSRVAVVGAGGLGTPVLQYLTAAGVGSLTIIDRDDIEETNLQRQVIYDDTQIGQAKVACAAEAVKRLNPEVRVTTQQVALDEGNAAPLLEGADLVVAATDTLGSRYAINRVCALRQVPLVSGSAVGTSGQLTSFNYQDPHDPCLQCLYGDMLNSGQACAESGVLGPVVGTLGALMATEALKLLLGIGDVLRGRLLCWDALTMDWQTMHYCQRDDCPVCGGAS